MPRAKRQHLKQRADGRYACRYKDKWFMGLTEDEALAAREEYKRQERLAPPPDRLTVAQYAAQWLPLHKRGVSDKCYNDYAKQLDALIAVIGNKLFADVTTDDAKRIYVHYDGYSQSTIKRARMLYISLFDTAIDNGIATRNPFRSKFAQPDRGTEGTHRIITLEERDLILNTPHRMQLGVLVMLYAGLRRGEALALNLDTDVDFNRHVIHVRRAVRYAGNAPIMTRPKTAAGSRDVPLLPILEDALRGSSGWLIQSAKGTQATETAFRRSWQSYMTALTKSAGHPVSIRCHDLRHSYCTMLRDAGVEMKLAMLWMGHSDEKMILRVYDHVTDARAAEGVARVEKLLLGRQNGRQKVSNY